MLKKICNNIEDFVTVVLLASMSIIITIQVFMRYVAQSSLSWSEELARYMFIYIIYFGISMAVKEDRHIRVEAAITFFPKKVQDVIKIISDILFFVFALIIAIKGYEVIIRMNTMGQQSPALGIPMTYIYAAPFVGYAIILLRLLQNIYYKIRYFNNEENVKE